MNVPRQELIRQGRELGLIEINLNTGTWGLSKQGRDFLDLFDLLRELDDRPPRRAPSSPRRQAQAARSTGSGDAPTRPRRGDDDPERRGKRGDKTSAGG